MVVLATVGDNFVDGLVPGLPLADCRGVCEKASLLGQIPSIDVELDAGFDGGFVAGE